MSIAKNGFAALASLDAGTWTRGGGRREEGEGERARVQDPGRERARGREDIQTHFPFLGYYGKGIYFSTSAVYIIPYFASKKRPAVLVSLLLPGNPFPVIENPHEEVCSSSLSPSLPLPSPLSPLPS
jgi:hypothetical protein